MHSPVGEMQSPVGEMHSPDRDDALCRSVSARDALCRWRRFRGCFLDLPHSASSTFPTALPRPSTAPPVTFHPRLSRRVQGWADGELAKLTEDVRSRGLGLVVAADWYARLSPHQTTPQQPPHSHPHSLPFPTASTASCQPPVHIPRPSLPSPPLSTCPPPPLHSSHRYDPQLMRRLFYRDERTAIDHHCGFGGANVPALNALLQGEMQSPAHEMQSPAKICNLLPVHTREIQSPAPAHAPAHPPAHARN